MLGERTACRSRTWLKSKGKCYVFMEDIKLYNMSLIQFVTVKT
jgi:hypothetical protein